jgi:hypothetical protein
MPPHSPVSESSKDGSIDSPTLPDEKSHPSSLPYESTTPSFAPLADSTKGRPEAALGDAVLRFFRIRTGGPRIDLDAVSIIFRG